MSDVMEVMFRRTSLLLCALCLVCGCAAQAAPPDRWTTVEQHWYSVLLGEAKVGWMSSTVEGDGQRYRSVTETEMSFDRGAFSATIQLRSAFTETAAGEPVSLEFTQSMAQQPVHVLYRFEDDHVVRVSSQGDREIETRLPLPEGDWLTPMSAHRYWTARREAGDRTITYRTIQGETGMEPVDITNVYVKDGQFQMQGKPVPVTIWTSTNSVMPQIKGTEMFTADGVLVQEEVSIPMLGTTVTRLTTEDLARAPGDAAAQPELLVKTFVKPDRPIRNPGRAVTATLNLRVAEGSMPALPSAGAQRVAPDPDGRSAVLTIDVNDNLPDADADPPAYLGSSTLVDAEDPVIKALANDAVRGVDADTEARAEALRAAVHRFVTEIGLDTVFATASETAETRAGDCSEHAVLLCAMLRSQGIPARVAIGLVYAESFLGHNNIFGWHMWTQALIDGTWIDLDATLPRRYHAAHVLISTTSLDDDILGTEVASALMLMGNLEIEVVDVGYE